MLPTSQNALVGEEKVKIRTLGGGNGSVLWKRHSKCFSFVYFMHWKDEKQGSLHKHHLGEAGKW